MSDERTPPTGKASIDASAPTLLQAARFAPRWFADAKREAVSADLDSRRREILFAVCPLGNRRLNHLASRREAVGERVEQVCGFNQ